MLIRGDHLGPQLRAEVLAAYGYRWTIENAERAWAWMPNDARPQASEDDTDWLASHYFHVTKRGTLDRRSRHCEAVP